MDRLGHIIAVSGLVRNGAGNVLMVRNPQRGWEIPGGKVEDGEDLFVALRREISEETGVSVVVGSLGGVYVRLRPPFMVLFSFLCEWVSGDLVTSAESVEVAWVAQDRVLERVAHPAIHARVRDLLNASGKVVYRSYSTDPYLVYEQRLL